jgi:hypothetical protein
MYALVLNFFVDFSKKWYSYNSFNYDTEKNRNDFILHYDMLISF